MNSPKSPLVCIHGFSGSGSNWDSVVPALEQHHTVHVAELAGHARGTALPEGTPATVDALADHLERDLDRAGISSAHLVGNSLGGWLALELAARGRALSVTALSPALGWEPEGKHLKTLSAKLRIARALYSAVSPRAEFVLKSARIRQALLGGAMAHSGRLPVETATAFLHDNLECQIYVELMDSFLSTNHELGSIECPVKIAWSEKDALIPYQPYGDRFPDLVANAQFSTLADVGHVPMYDDPDLVVSTIVEMTEAVDAATPGTV